MRTYQLIITFAVAFLISMGGYAQRQKVKNLPKFDRRKFHFGFMIGYNAADFFLRQKADFTFSDSLLSIRHMQQPGFNIQPVADMHIAHNLILRFTPGISFQDRALEYAFLVKDNEGADEIEKEQKRIESTFLDFPLLLKYRSDRINNFAVYVIGGGKYAMDMASQEDVNNATNTDKIIKIKRDDYSGEVGFGFDFFLHYFKFGIELRYSVGFPNVFIDDDTRYSRPIESIRTKQWLLSFTFEG